MYAFFVYHPNCLWGFLQIVKQQIEKTSKTDYNLIFIAKRHTFSPNFRAPFISAHLVCAKMKGARKRPIFVHFDAQKLMGARNSEISFMSRKIFFKGSDFILTMSKGSFLIREAHQAEHKERLRSRKQYL